MIMANELGRKSSSLWLSQNYVLLYWDCILCNPVHQSSKVIERMGESQFEVIKYMDFFQNKEMPFYYFKVHKIAYAKFKSFVSKWRSQWSDGHISVVGM